MSSANPLNTGIALGKLVKTTVKRVEGKDAVSVQFRLAVRQNFKSKNTGKYGYDFIIFNRYILKASQSYLLKLLEDKENEGQYVTVSYHVQTNKDKNGKIKLYLIADTITFLWEKLTEDQATNTHIEDNPFKMDDYSDGGSVPF